MSADSSRQGGSAHPAAGGGKSAWPAILGVVFLAGLGGWCYEMIAGDGPRAWRALLVCFLFFAPLAAGMVVWPAVALAARGRWAVSIEPPALRALYFGPLSLAMLGALWIGAGSWAPWSHHEYHQGWWMRTDNIFARDMAALLAFWVVAAIFVRKRSRKDNSHQAAGSSQRSDNGKKNGNSYQAEGSSQRNDGSQQPAGNSQRNDNGRKNDNGQQADRRPEGFGGFLALVYALVFSLLGFDLVMGLDEHWFSSLAGGYFFISGLYIAMACWAVTMVLRGAARNKLHDLGKLMVAFSLLTTYMMYAQLLPLWYENIQHEVGYLHARMTGQWHTLSLVLLGTVYLGPLVLLLPRAAKRKPAYLLAVASAVLAGMWVERWWLVTPTLGGPMSIGVGEVSLAVGLAAAVGLCLRTPIGHGNVLDG